MGQWRRIGMGVLLGWCAVASLAALIDARARSDDPIARFDGEFRAFAPFLPKTGEVGFLEPREGGGSPEAVRLHYAAQYALVPRVVVARTGPEFLIVPAAHVEQSSPDPRLAEYVRIASLPSGHQLYRRFQ